ncbi:unnamed protein product [Rotaria magnacalcarata]|uniref:Uncharacterized protein n=4 Tax=Rotaria magnacalcarata TaxID=392030 RepID=A0A814H317_9BILA|nr:unnamed protein product [Rotaria magnacalcarata]CAF1601028.1 unnamed protein product [Rotaria magnacalcarata]CAF3856211.1 unnamed protein product [Rotaria magnacalcarata]
MLFLFIFLFSIHLLQSCPLTDEYLSRCHCGILTNGESYIKCDENSLNHIPKFKRSYSYDELILINNNIKNLSSTSFDNIKTIKRINLHGNSLSLIDENLFRLLGNYLEELILTGNNQINSLEFLTRFPLKKLRLLKLNRFNLTNINLEKIFLNMTNLEIVYLNSCQLKQIPHINHIKYLDLEDNFLSNTIFLSTSYYQLNLAHNHISSIILQNNKNLISLNLSKNNLNEFYSLTISNKNLTTLDLSYNHLTSIDWIILNDKLLYLNLSSNYFSTIKLNSFPKSLTSLDLSSNQLKTIEKNLFFQQLNYLNLNLNPFDCDCHLKWLRNLMKKLNTTTWSCSSSDFKCQSNLMPQISIFNITFMKYFSQHGFSIQWSIIDNYQTIDYLQITIDKPYRTSRKISSNQTHAIILNNIELYQYYHICLILIHKYANDKYCQDIFTKTPILNKMKLQETDVILNDDNNNNNEIEINTNDFNDNHLYLLLIGSCIGALLTFILLLTCCYLCYRLHKYKNINEQPIYEQCSQHIHYPIYHSHPTCSHHQIIYNSENISNSTDSSRIDASLSSTTNNPKHIYQTIDSQEYRSLKRQHQQLFELWKESVKQNR